MNCIFADAKFKKCDLRGPGLRLAFCHWQPSLRIWTSLLSVGDLVGAGRR
ncbi:hypothetical protein [Pantoea ananatis]